MCSRASNWLTKDQSLIFTIVLARLFPLNQVLWIQRCLYIWQRLCLFSSLH